MKRFLFHTLGFVPALLFGVAAMMVMAQAHPRISYMLFGKASEYGHTIQRTPDFAERDTGPDLLFLGSSTCYRGMDPRPFESRKINAFNLCSSSQTFFNAHHLLHWSLDEEKQPRHLLLDIYPKIWSGSGIEASRDLTINNNLAHHAAFQKMAWATADIQTILKASYFGIMRLFKPHGVIQGTSDRYIPGGFTYSIQSPVDSVECVPDTCELNRTQRQAFERIRRTCEKEGIQLLLVNPPQLCEEVFEKPEVMEGLPWIEGNDWPLAKVDTLYYDDHHLRGVGAELYSEWLAGQVAALMN